jgi:hypothetical protein
MSEDRYDKSHHSGATPEARIAARYRNSGSPTADHVVQTGNSPNRLFTNIHSHGQGGASRRIDLEKGGIKSGLGAPEEPGIDGRKRDVV